MELKESLIKLFNIIYSKFPIKYDYISELKRVLAGCKTVLDVGCGSNSPIRFLSGDIYLVGVDKFEPWLEKSEEDRIHDKYYALDVLKIEELFVPNTFDCVIALDLIEHLSKKDGNKLIDLIERIAKRKIVIFTPNGYIPQGELDNNPWEVHKSGWTVEEMREKGYHIIGINGWKFLIGEYGLIKFRPKFFWYLISLISQLCVRNYPKKAAQILCVKVKEEE